MNRKRRLMVLAVLAVGVMSMAADRAIASIEVQVGYADDQRSSPFFPNPWSGGSGVQYFNGSSPNIDAGAIRVINNGGSAILIQDLIVDSFGTGQSFQIWGGFLGAGQSLSPGMSAIFTQTTQFDFDSSDYEGSNPAAIP